MEKLPELLAQHGISFWLQRTRGLAALVDQNGKLLEWNPAFDMLQPGRPSIDSLESLVEPDDRPLFNDLRLSAREAGKPCHTVLHLLPETGRGTEYDSNLIPLPAGQFIFLAELIAHDAALAEANQNLSQQVAQLTVDNEAFKQRLTNKQIEIDAIVAQAQEVAHTDALTFLPNRRQIIGDLQREVFHAERYKTPLAISMVDVDKFKAINDTYGHAAGDVVLRAIARSLREHIREPDIVGRYGGEEFLVILPNARLQAAILQATRLCRCIRETSVPVEDRELRVTISAGVAEYCTGQEDWQKFLSRADAAMYEAKDAGRDRWAAAR